MSVEAKIKLTIGGLNLDTDLSIGQGERVALMGPNGAGKTTMLRTLCGLVPLDGGLIAIAGALVDDPGARVFVAPEKRSIGYCPQDHALFADKSALDNVAFGLRARGASRNDANNRAQVLLDEFGLGAFSNTPVNEFSAGQSQRVALARALVTDSKLYLLDEPTAALDSDSRKVAHAIINRLVAERGATLIVVTHDVEEASAVADRVVEVRR